MKVLAAILSALLLLTSCHAIIPAVKPPLEDEGELYLYVRPFAAQLARLRFEIAGVSAVRDDGSDVPLTIALADLNGSDMNRQRFLASGPVPPGNYSGLKFTVRQARLRTAEGSADLNAPATGVMADGPFVVQRRKAQLLSLTLNPDRALGSGVVFTPAFTISLPSRPVPGLTGYVTNSDANSITVFDKQAREVVGVIATGRTPTGLAIDQLARRAYEALAGDDAVDVIDLSSNEVMTRIRLNPGDSPQDLALTPDNRTLLTVNSGTNSVSIIDPQGLFEQARLAVGNVPGTILIDPSGLRGYVFNDQSDTVSVVDIPRRTVAAVFATESGPSRGQFNRRGDSLYLIHQRSSYLTLMNPATLAVQQRYYVGMGTGALKLDTATGLIYAGKSRMGDIDVYEPFSLTPVARIGTGGSTTYLTIDGDENNLLVLNGARGSLQMVNLVSRKTVGEIDVGASPRRVALMGER